MFEELRKEQHYDLVMQDCGPLCELPYSEYDTDYHDAGKFLLHYDSCSEEITVWMVVDKETHDAIPELYKKFSSFGITMRYLDDGTPVLKIETFPYSRKMES